MHTGAGTGRDFFSGDEIKAISSLFNSTSFLFTDPFVRGSVSGENNEKNELQRMHNNCGPLALSAMLLARPVLALLLFPLDSAAIIRVISFSHVTNWPRRASFPLPIIRSPEIRIGDDSRRAIRSSVAGLMMITGSRVCRANRRTALRFSILLYTATMFPWL